MGGKLGGGQIQSSKTEVSLHHEQDDPEDADDGEELEESEAS